MKQVIIGYEKKEYFNKKTGREVKGANLYYENVYEDTELNKDLVGRSVGSVYVRAGVIEEIQDYFGVDDIIGLTGEFVYDRWKNVVGFQKRK